MNAKVDPRHANHGRAMNRERVLESSRQAIQAERQGEDESRGVTGERAPAFEIGIRRILRERPGAWIVERAQAERLEIREQPGHSHGGHAADQPGEDDPAHLSPIGVAD